MKTLDTKCRMIWLPRLFSRVTPLVSWEKLEKIFQKDTFLCYFVNGNVKSIFCVTGLGTKNMCHAMSDVINI